MTRRFLVAVAALIAVTVAALVAGVIAPRAQAATAQPHVIVVGVPQLTWADVDATTTVYSSDSVDTSSSGSHSLRYNATDSSGNAAAEISRTVIVDPEPSRRRSGGGGGGGGGSKKSEPAVSRTLFGDPATLTPEARAALIQELLAQVRVLLALLAQMRANGL